MHRTLSLVLLAFLAACAAPLDWPTQVEEWSDANTPLVRSRFLAATEIVASDPVAQAIIRVAAATHIRNMERLSHTDMPPISSELVQVKLVSEVSAMVYFRGIRSSARGYTTHHYDYFYVVERASGAWRHTATYSVLTIMAQT